MHVIGQCRDIFIQQHGHFSSFNILYLHSFILSSKLTYILFSPSYLAVLIWLIYCLRRKKMQAICAALALIRESERDLKKERRENRKQGERDLERKRPRERCVSDFVTFFFANPVEIHL